MILCRSHVRCPLDVALNVVVRLCELQVRQAGIEGIDVFVYAAYGFVHLRLRVGVGFVGLAADVLVLRQVLRMRVRRIAAEVIGEVTQFCRCFILFHEHLLYVISAGGLVVITENRRRVNDHVRSRHILHITPHINLYASRMLATDD